MNENSKLLGEVIAVVEELSEVVGNVDNYDGNLDIFVLTNADVTLVKFLGIQIWNSEDDERRYIDDDFNEYEPIKDYLYRQVRYFSSMIGRLRAVRMGD